jgi:hypothetical protein
VRKNASPSRAIAACVATLLCALPLTACEYLEYPARALLDDKKTPESPPGAVPTAGIPAPQPTAPAATPTPEPPSPTPTPEPVAAGSQLTEGQAVVRIRGINRLPLQRTRDYLVAATFTWETSGSDKRLPIAELSIRGTRSQPCLRTPCGDAAGLVVRVTANPAYDSGQQDEHRHCGSGTNYHRRLAIGPLGSDGGVDVTMRWDRSGLHVSTPVDSVFLPTRVAGSVGFGRFLVGAPFRHGERGYGWDALSIDRFGGDAQLVAFHGTSQRRNACP